MTITLVLNSLLLSVSTWYTLPAPPDSITFSDAFAEEPIEVLVFMARSGWNPDWMDIGALPAALLQQYPSDSALIAWTASLMDVPFRTDMTPLLIEYGDIHIIPDPESITADPQLLNAFLRRLQHMIIAGEERDDLEKIVEVITGTWNDLPLDTKVLSLEVLGRLGIDVTGDISFGEFSEADFSAAARYCSELGREYAFTPEADESNLERIYRAACSPPDKAASMFSDPLWAVRFNAVAPSDPASLEQLLTDSIPYVRLSAALTRRDAGYPDGIAVIREIAL
ncbi:MAG: hypothetical protein ABFR50_12085, partial [Candidatus Fermentibacteria bacterium]